MTVGLALTKNGIDNTAGGIAQNLNKAFEEVRQFQEWLAGQQDADLEANYSYSADDVAVMKSAFSDLDQLRTIYEGGAALASVKDFRAFAKQTWGLGF